MAKLPSIHVPTEIKNLAINGGMDFFQRIEGSTTTITTGGGYGADMFSTAVGGTTSKSLSYLRSTNVPSQAQSGYQGTYSYEVINNTAVSTLASTDYYDAFKYKMEGLDYAKIHGKVATFSFWFSTTVAGTYSFVIRNGSYTRAYATTFSAATGWQFIALTVQMDTSAGGTWAFDTTIGADIDIAGISGSSFSTSTLNSWQTVSGGISSTTSNTNWAATAGATLNIAQFAITEGPLGFSATGFQRAGKDIQQELALCQRYYEKTYDQGTLPGTVGFSNSAASFRPASYSRANLRMMVYYKATKRTTPTLTVYNPNVSNASGFYYDSDAGTSVAVTISENGTNTADLSGPSTTTSSAGPDRYHWTADAGL